MRVTFLCCVALLVVPYVDSAPAPVRGLKAKEQLEALKKRLRNFLADWMKEKNQHFDWMGTDWTYKPEVRLLRRVGPERAKVVILFTAADAAGRRDSDRDVLLTIFFAYQDGCWTTEQFEVNICNFGVRPPRATFAFLMLAIDEAAEK
ncbi:MAG TPA: hypothetical protein VMG10_29550 [Gemmataceae bacterium]|nr:hypothetical protein [Gemmataceae bacterium]